jgi:mannosylglycoprotein endo-beta-mannosidase
MFLSHFRFIKKFSFVAAQLRRWNKDDFGDQEHKLQIVISQIDDLERKQEVDPLCPLNNLKLESLIRDKWTYSNRVECKWRQRSRQLWCKLGDHNTRFFHLIANFRRAKSQIIMINHKGAKLRSLPEVKSTAVDYFYNLYKAPIRKKAEMGPISFKRLNQSFLFD